MPFQGIENVKIHWFKILIFQEVPMLKFCLKRCKIPFNIIWEEKWPIQRYAWTIDSLRTSYFPDMYSSCKYLEEIVKCHPNYPFYWEEKPKPCFIIVSHFDRKLFKFLMNRLPFCRCVMTGERTEVVLMQFSTSTHKL